MRTKICLALALFSLVAVQHSIAAAQAAQSPEALLKEFYTWYIHVNFQNLDPLKGNARAAFGKYVTARFIREIDRNEKLPEGESFDADYFLQTQDPLPGPDSSYREDEWLKSMAVSSVAVKGMTATAVVTFFKGYPTVKVSLLKEGGVWKINNVKDAR
ncbi:MAG: YbjP/YqhG family protein [Acidobacteriota bacterium]|nr:YbjP/YqhG family protein [Acidobacteriota bacterium]